MHSFGVNTNFFLESYTPVGLVSFFDSFYNSSKIKRTYLITGTLGAVDSVLIQKVTDKVTALGVSAQKISNALCSSQLDAVYFEGLDVCLLNGGETGRIRQNFPVAAEKTVSLTDTVNCGAIEQNANEIKKLFCEEAGAKKRAAGFLSAASTMLTDTKELAKRCTDFEKIARYASRFARRELPVIRGKRGREYKRFLSSITYRGIETYTSTLRAVCSDFRIISDAYGASCEYLLGLLKGYVLGSGYDVVSCYCPMSNGISTQHLIVPEKKLCFFSENSYHPADFSQVRRISANRFTDLKALSQHKKRLRFNARAANEMIAEAVKLLALSENARNKLRLIYLSCTDETKLMRFAERISSEIIS